MMSFSFTILSASLIFFISLSLGCPWLCCPYIFYCNAFFYLCILHSVFVNAFIFDAFALFSMSVPFLFLKFFIYLNILKTLIFPYYKLTLKHNYKWQPLGVGLPLISVNFIYSLFFDVCNLLLNLAV